MLRISREFAETAGGSRRHSTTSSNSNTTPAVSTFGRAVFVSSKTKTKTSSYHMPSRSLVETPNARTVAVAPALSMLSVVSDKRAPSRSSSTFTPIDDTQTTRLNSPEDDASHTEDEDLYDDDNFEGAQDDSFIQDTINDEFVVADTQFPDHRFPQQQQLANHQVVAMTPVPPEWDNIPPDMVIRSMKALKPEILQGAGLRDYFKSYPSWEKMKPEQRNKSLSWFRSLPDHLQGLFLFVASAFII